MPGLVEAVINERGKQLIDFGCEGNLKIMNGSAVGDPLGKWTCYRYNGNSTVDYILVSHNLKDKISYLKVLDLTEHSNQMLLLLLHTQTVHAANKPAKPCN